MNIHEKKNSDIKHSIIFIAITLLITFIVYFPSLDRAWQFFDERSFYEEGLFPIASSITELFEIIKTYAFTYHIGSQNTFFSNIITVRANVLGAIMNIFITFLFKGNSLLYHLLQISIHLINTILVWKIFSLLLNKKSELVSNLTISILALIWALHPTNIESVLLGTNWTSLVTYSFCFWLTLTILKKATSFDFTFSTTRNVLYTVLFCISLLISEYSYALPPVLFFISFYFAYSKSGLITESCKKAFILCIPFIIGALLFASYYLFKFAFLTQSNTTAHYTNVSVERFFFLTPQIFIYFFKLFFFPIVLSLYQTIFMKLSHELISPYSIFAFLVFIGSLILPVVLFLTLKQKNKKWALVLLTYSFLFALFPFLHIITPTYCLIADRYCYFPLFITIVIILITFKELNWTLCSKKAISILILALLPLMIQTSLRVKDWKNTESLFSSDLKQASTPLDKGQIYSILLYHNDSIGKTDESLKYAVLTIRELNKVINELKDKISLTEPQTLISYGLDYKSLLLRAAFSIADTRYNFLKEEPTSVLDFYKPYIQTYLSYAGSSHINLYAKLLKDTGQTKEAISILEEGRIQYPYSPHLIYTLSNLYINQGEFAKAEKIIDEGYKVYPSYPRMLLRKITISELKNNTKDLAYYEYLLGLRTHSEEGYQKAVQLYMQLNDLRTSKVIFGKLLQINENNPVTLLLLSKYFNLTGASEKVIPTLEKAYTLSQIQASIDKEVYESIVLSLISFNLAQNNHKNIQKYIVELEKLPNLLKKHEAYLSSVKRKLNLQ